MAQTRPNFDPATGDDTTGALRKLDNNCADLDTRVAAAIPAPNGVASAPIKWTGATTIFTGSVTVGKDTAPAGPLDVRTGSGGWVMRTFTYGSVPEPTIDAITETNSALAPLNIRGTYFSMALTAGPRLLVRSPTSGGGVTLDSVNSSNTVVQPMAFTSTGYTFNGGNMQVNGSITATGSITPSDRRLKEHIVPRQVNRGMALALARAFSEWDLIASGIHQAGVVAQDALEICPFWVPEIDYRPPPVFVEGSTEGEVQEMVKRLAVDVPGMALESSMDNALSIEELRTALAAALDRITALEGRPGT